MQFYHSFPRCPNQQDHQYGLNVLDSILRIGLLITPEVRMVSSYKNLGVAGYIQQRVCFTAIEAGELAKHANFFGEFALEFEPDSLRELGALPAFYLAGTLENGELLHQAGEHLLRLLLKARSLLWMVKTLQEEGSPDVKQLIGERFPVRMNDKDAFLEEVPYAIEALLNLYYPTDDFLHEKGKDLAYYKQREWKVVPNFAVNNQWQYPKIPDAEKEELLALNYGYFSKELGPNAERRVDLCQCFKGFGTEPLLNRVKRLIVPDAVVSEATQKVVDSCHTFPVVPLSQV